MKKMKKMHYKRIMGLFILLFVFLATSPVNVVAETQASACAYLNSSSNIPNRYGLDIDIEDDGRVKVTMKDASPSTSIEKSSIKFKIFRLSTFKSYDDSKVKLEDAIDYTDSKKVTDEEEIKKYVSSVTLKPGGTVYIKRKDVLASQQGIEVALKPEGFTDSWLSKKIKTCKPKKNEKYHDGWYAQVFLDIQGSQGGGTYTTTLDTSKEDTTGQTDCTKKDTYDKNSLDYLFCDAIDKAKQRQEKDNKKRFFEFDEIKEDQSNAGTLYSAKNKNKREEFTCDKTTIIDGQSLLSKRLNSEDYFAKYGANYYLEANREYRYGKANITKSVDYYEYHYEKYMATHENAPYKEAATCKLQCEEALIVEYGPPVASEAGLCFGYKVKLTSIVSCKQIEKIKKPSTTANWCVPYPICVHKGGKTYNQGGPTSDFDKCINNCDKGKYTDKCVTKCYKKVYGNTNVKEANALDLEYDPSRFDNDGVLKNPKHTITKNGYISWENGTTSRSHCNTGNHFRVGNGWNYECRTDAPWHRDNSWGCNGGYDAYSSNGIPKRTSCTDSCNWRGCSDEKIYINEEQAKRDADVNAEKYKELKNKCSAAATCTTTTAEFNIKVNKNGMAVVNDNGDDNEGTIVFPYSEKKDELTSLSKKDLEPTKLADDTTIIGFNGCYKDFEQRRWYQTEWTFPGTWIESKSHRMQFEPTKENGYRVYEGLFCLPRNTKPVNKDWWWYYYANVTSGTIDTSPWILDKNCSDDPTDDKPPCKYSINDSNYMNNIDKCKSSNGSGTATCDLSSKKDANKLPKPTMNIRAESNRFGYFGWNISIDCFYAMVKDKTCPTPTNTSTSSSAKVCKDPINTETGYRIRTVDLANLFPSEEGTKLTNPASTGRSPGFNWSEYATQTTKDKGFISNPKAYTKYVQERGNKIYSDENMDYRIKLTKDMITEVKQKVRSGEIDYGKPINDNGSIIENSSVIHYKSAYIRESGRGIVYPGDTALKCNNIGERKKDTKSEGYTASCQEFE